jgi:hypothetical protein
MKWYKSLFLVILLLLSFLTKGMSQELTPRAYWPAPYGTKIAAVGYSYSFGDILTDPSLSITGANSDIHSVVFVYAQTLNLFGRTTNMLVEIPYVWSATEGDINNPYEISHEKREMRGIADIGITFSINLIGAPTMTVKDFQDLREDPHQILGATFKLVTPTGKYEADKLLNVGTNRWSFKTELGYMIPLTKKWLLEFELGAWFFTYNSEFLGKTRKQKPIGNAQLHLIHRFTPGFWVAFNLNYFWGGSTNLANEDLQRNSKMGVTLVYPLSRLSSLKFGASMGVVTASGGDFKTLLLSYQMLLN